MSELTDEELNWLRFLMKYRPGEETEPPVPKEIRLALIERRLAYLRRGVDLEITFDGIREVLSRP